MHFFLVILYIVVYRLSN